jgi:hypothetical protein
LNGVLRRRECDAVAGAAWPPFFLICNSSLSFLKWRGQMPCETGPGLLPGSALRFLDLHQAQTGTRNGNSLCKGAIITLELYRAMHAVCPQIF